MLNLTREQAAIAAMAVGYSLNEAKVFPQELDTKLIELNKYMQEEVYPQGRAENLRKLRELFELLVRQVLEQ